MKIITLRKALELADEVSIDGYEMENCAFLATGNEVRLERADEEAFVFDLDSEVELTDGRAYFVDSDGEEHEFVFCVHHPLEGEDA